MIANSYSKWTAERHALELKSLATRIRNARATVDTRVSERLLGFPAKFVERQQNRRQAKYLEIEAHNRKLLQKLQLVGEESSVALKLAGFRQHPSRTGRANLNTSSTYLPNQESRNFTRRRRNAVSVQRLPIAIQQCDGKLPTLNRRGYRAPSARVQSQKARANPEISELKKVEGQQSSTCTLIWPESSSTKGSTARRRISVQHRRPPQYPTVRKQSESIAPGHLENLLLALITAPTPGRTRQNRSPNVGENTRRHRLLERLEGGIRKGSLFCLED